MPAPVRVAAFVPLPGDGVWAPSGRLVGASAAVYTTVLHHGGEPIGVASLDTRRLRFALYAGTSQPSGVWPNDGAVAAPLWGSLVAAFNSGFQLSQSNGGWYEGGRTAVALRVGAASFVVRTDGTATVGLWGRDAVPGPTVAAVRQNLTLLVDAGAATAASASTNPIAVWGVPLHGQVSTWRSALGIDRTGRLIYLAGPALYPSTLAAAMVAAGAERAMELDMNPEWVSFDSFTGVGPTVAGTKLLSGMYFPTTHFLSPFWRDFVAVFTRTS